jgi:hypothetical protein
MAKLPPNSILRPESGTLLATATEWVRRQFPGFRVGSFCKENEIGLRDVTDSCAAEHYDAFPRTIGHVTQLFRASEWHLTFTQGRWSHRLWGIQPQTTGPTGVRLWTWFEGDDEWAGHVLIREGGEF